MMKRVRLEFEKVQIEEDIQKLEGLANLFLIWRV